jgi:hypothetical protein
VKVPDEDARLQLPTSLLAVDESPGRTSNQSTARRAVAILVERPGFRVASAREKRNLAEAFASHNKPVYGQAFDAVHLGAAVDLRDVAAIKRNISQITLYEVKATDRVGAREDFAGHFFSMSTAELLVAQKLGEQFRFAFVDVNSRQVLDLTLQEIFARAKAIYPTWSIRF